MTELMFLKAQTLIKLLPRVKVLIVTIENFYHEVQIKTKGMSWLSQFVAKSHEF